MDEVFTANSLPRGFGFKSWLSFKTLFLFTFSQKCCVLETTDAELVYIFILFGFSKVPLTFLSYQVNHSCSQHFGYSVNNVFKRSRTKVKRKFIKIITTLNTFFIQILLWLILRLLEKFY